MRTLQIKGKYKEAILSGKKRATIRTRCNFKEGEEVFLHCGNSIIGIARITEIKKKDFNSLSQKDALIDGFGSLEDLKEELKIIYGENLDKMTFYVIRFQFLRAEEEKTPSSLYYGDKSPVEIAKLALKNLELSEEEKRILEAVLEVKSIKKAALLLGSWKKRGKVREVLRQCYLRLKKKGLI